MTGREAEPSKRTTSTGKSEAAKVAGRKPSQRADLAQDGGVGGGNHEVGGRQPRGESSGWAPGEGAVRRRHPTGRPSRDPPRWPARRAGPPNGVARARADGRVQPGEEDRHEVSRRARSRPEPRSRRRRPSRSPVRRPAPSAVCRDLVAAVRSADYRGDRAALARLDAELGRLPDDRLVRVPRLLARLRAVEARDERVQRDADAGRPREGPARRGRAVRGGAPEAPRLDGGAARAGRLLGQPHLPRRQRRGEEEGDPGGRRARPSSSSWRTRATTRARSGSAAEWSSPRRRRSAETSRRRRRRSGTASRARGARRVERPDAPPWVPAWGGPENMMNLAYMYAHAPPPDRAVALAYAERGRRRRAGVALRPRRPDAADRGAPGGKRAGPRRPSPLRPRSGD